LKKKEREIWLLQWATHDNRLNKKKEAKEALEVIMVDQVRK